MADPATSRSHRQSVRTVVVWRYLGEALAERVAVTGRHSLDVVDAGGGTGGFAVPLAQLGHHVTVVDPSPDALAALGRRAAEADVTEQIRPMQGDAAELLTLVGPQSADVVLCHGVLEIVDDPSDALAAVARVLRPGGVVSVLAANRHSAVLTRALGGYFVEARYALDDPAGRWGEADPVPRRFAAEDLEHLLGAVGFSITAIHGVRIFSDLVPGAVTDDPSSLQALLDVETAAAEHPVFRAIATQIHVLARHD